MKIHWDMISLWAVLIFLLFIPAINLGAGAIGSQVGAEFPWIAISWTIWRTVLASMLFLGVFVQLAGELRIHYLTLKALDGAKTAVKLKESMNIIMRLFCIVWAGLCLLKYGLFEGLLYFFGGLIIVALVGRIGAAIIATPLPLWILGSIVWISPVPEIAKYGGWPGMGCYLVYPMVLVVLLAFQKKKENRKQEREITEQEVQSYIAKVRRYHAYFSPGRAKESNAEERDDTDEKLKLWAVQRIIYEKSIVGLPELWDDNKSRLKLLLFLLLPTAWAFVFLGKEASGPLVKILSSVILFFEHLLNG